jgi:predicted aldo/keto reductase-like oxidoreductase
METRTLGRTDLQVGTISLGTEHLLADREFMDALLDLAVSGGVNNIDLFSDPSFGNIGEYIEATGPAVSRYRERLVFCIHWGVWQRAVRSVPVWF